jgi:hypothetical protein
MPLAVCNRSAIVSSGPHGRRLLVYFVDSGTLNGYDLPRANWISVLSASENEVIVETEIDSGSNSGGSRGIQILRLNHVPTVVGSLKLQAPFTWEGPGEAWGLLPRANVYSGPEGPDALLLLGQETGSSRLVQIPDHPALSADWDGPLLVAQVPGRESIVVARGGGRAVVVLDPDAGIVRGAIEIPDSLLTQQSPVIRPGTSELWVSSRLKLVRVDVDARRVLGVLDVGTWREDQVIDFAFNDSFTTCAVALYTSGVVLAIDVDAFQVTHKAETGESLQRIAILDDGRFVSQAWSSDRFTVGQLFEHPFSLPTVSGR